MSRTPAETLRVARELEKSLPARTPRLAVLASFTADLLRPHLLVESHEIGWPLVPWIGPFNQLEQQLLNDSALWNTGFDAVWIALRLQDAEPQLSNRALAWGAPDVRARLGKVVARLVALARAARARTSAPIVVSNLEMFEAAGNPFDASDPVGLTHLVAEANRALAEELRRLTDTWLFDWAGQVASVGVSEFCDPKLWYLGRVAIAPAAMPVVARSLSRVVAAVSRPAAKCIVVDLDNTLWGGVLGDDGVEGIHLGGPYPGSVFADVQEALRGFADRGFLLAVASKNDLATVVTALDGHREMLLRTHDFACIRAGWGPKPAALREIAETLNIGLDSLVFVDDSPVERAQVRAELPMVHVVELPADPLGFVPALRACAVLDRPKVLADDAARGKMYQDDSLRQAMRTGTTSLDDYIAQLEMVAEVGVCSKAEIERVHQLLAKTNQFNLTSNRHSLETVRTFSASESHRVAWIRLADKFGKLGLVGVVIVDGVGEQVAEIDTFVMSCRVMGRGVEDALLSYAAELARAAGSRRLRGLFRRTVKNTPVVDFYPSRAFRPMEPIGDLARFEKDLAGDGFRWPDAITRAQPTPPGSAAP